MNRVVPMSLALIGLAQLPALATPGEPAPDAGQLRSWVEGLCQPALEGRQFTKPGAQKAADWVAGEFAKLGLRSLSAGKPYEHPFVEGGSRGVNVLGLLEAASPDAPAPDQRETVVLEAHFDHLGPLSPGASDNAAGVAVVLEAASALAAHPERLKRDVLFASFDGEEMGWVGATAYAKRPAVPLKRTAAFIDLDAMGRPLCDLRERRLIAFGAERSAGLQAVLARHAAACPQITPLGTDLIGDRSDYVPFRQAAVPFLFFFNGTHKDYHDLGDTPEKLDYRALGADAAAVRRVVLDLASQTAPLGVRSPVALPGEAGVVRAYWRRLGQPLAQLPAHLEREVPGLARALPGLGDPVVPGTPSRKTLARAMDMVFYAGTPWYAKLMTAIEEGARLEKAGDREGALATYRQGLSHSRTWAGVAYLTGKIEALSKASGKPSGKPAPQAAPKASTGAEPGAGAEPGERASGKPAR